MRVVLWRDMVAIPLVSLRDVLQLNTANMIMHACVLRGHAFSCVLRPPALSLRGAALRPTSTGASLVNLTTPRLYQSIHTWPGDTGGQDGRFPREGPLPALEGGPFYDCLRATQWHNL